MDSHLHDEEYGGRLDWGVWRILFSYAKPYRRNVAILITAGLVVAGCDAAFGLVMRELIDETQLNGVSAGLLRPAIHYIAVTLTLCACIVVFIRAAGTTAAAVCHDIRQASFARLQSLELAFYDRRPVGWLMARLTTDSDRLARIVGWMILDVVWGTSMVLCISTVMFVLNPRLAAVVVLVVPALCLLSVAFQRRLLASSRASRRTASEITAGYTESILGVRTTRSLVREDRSLREFQGLSGQLYGESVRYAVQSALYMPAVLTVVSCGTAAALGLGGQEVMAGGLSLGTLVLFLRYAGQIWDPIHEMAIKFADFQNAQAAAERVVTLLQTEPAIRDSAETMALAEQRPAARGIRRIQLDRVSFAYSPNTPKAIDELDLTVEAGQAIALVGPTGGGKSTLVNLVCRFYEPTGGVIRIDGTDYRRIPLLGLQSQLGMVLQAPHLFTGTIRNNIRYGRLNATDGEVERVARLVHAHEFITSLPRGYDSEVGPGGVRLSTGQKQLLSFARAVLADPQILVLDEATSSVDTETERQIQDALDVVLRGRISFVIAHRLSTIRRADRILFIEAGRIVEDGRHEELLRLGGRYHRLYTRQFRHEQEQQVLEEQLGTGLAV